MSALEARRPQLALAAVALTALLLASQSVAASSVPQDGRAATGRVLGKTGFAYLTGVRTFAAALLWNRIDPLYHEYYGEAGLDQLAFALPSMRLVTMLDPQFEQAYYVASFVVAKGGLEEEGISIARDGVEKNPESGLMRANLVNVLMFVDKDKNLPEMLAQTKAGVAPDVRWANDRDHFESLAVFRTVFKLSGDLQAANGIDQKMAWLKKTGDIGEDHDHDGDGVQDH